MLGCETLYAFLRVQLREGTSSQALRDFLVASYVERILSSNLSVLHLGSVTAAGLALKLETYNELEKRSVPQVI